MSSVIPERPEEERPAPSTSSPGWVVVPQHAQELTAEQQAALAESQRVARVWARVIIERLSRAQAAIDWSRDSAVQLIAFVRTHQELVIRLLLGAILLAWFGWWGG
jgi:hypothetical protein